MTVDEAVKALSKAGLVVEKMGTDDQRILGGTAQGGTASETGAFTISAASHGWQVVLSSASPQDAEVFETLEAAVQAMCERLAS